MTAIESSRALWYEVAVVTSVGKVKTHNEDFGATRNLPRGGCLVVTDGMSRLAGGEVASQLAAEALLASLDEQILDLDEEQQLDGLVKSLEAAHRALEDRVEADPGLTGMGTTVIAVLFGPERVVYQYAGDSRVYWLRNGATLRVTADHSVVAALVEIGHVRPEEAESHPMAGKLTSFLGGGHEWGSYRISPGPDESASFVPDPGDVVLVCTDGVYVELGETRLAELACARGSAEERAERIIAAVEQTAAKDNATVALACVHRVGADDVQG